ncbi:MAG: sugar phosphate isomerase/epimerase, partial [Lapillicoccus sp.]
WLAHVHLADGSGMPRGAPLSLWRGTQPCGELLEHLAAQDYRGDVIVEVGTRRLDDEQRERDLAQSLAFVRLYLAPAQRLQLP